MQYAHDPVMVREVMEILEPVAGHRYLDGTLGGGGHAEGILTLSSPSGELVGLDWDGDAIEAARKRLVGFGDRFIAFRANYVEAGKILRDLGWGKVNGLLLDLGLSSHDLNAPERGFSFQTESRLDMRMDRRQPLDAYTIVNTYSVEALARAIRAYGEEPAARRIARAIDDRRRRKAIETTKELAGVVAGALRPGGSSRRSKIHPATRTFQALRIAVNQELENLENFLQDAYQLLFSRGRMVVISFHSLEDRLVKEHFRKWDRSCLCPPRSPACACGWSRKAKVLTPRPLRSSPAEAEVNPHARSAKLRAVEVL